ncbi:hypothetical protein [uncultured Sphingomonas sp.]|uniref:hypothetical protein n=1 Tax=uncultured Sphingomonas sp. TaxID=158754 RepID=UPI0035CC2246
MTAEATERDLDVAGDRIRLRAGRDLYLGGRVGFLISPVAMGYLKGGYTNARFETRYDAPGLTFEDRTDADCFRF